MNRKVAFLLLVTAFLALSVTCAQAAQWESYVRGRKFASLKMVSNRPYVAVKAFFDALGFGYTQSEKGEIAVTRDPSARGSITFSYPSTSFSFAGRSFDLPTLSISGSTYVDLNIAGANMGLKVTRYEATRMFEVIDNEAMAVRAEEVAKYQAAQQAMQSGNANKSGAAFDIEHPVTQVGEIEGQLDQVTTWEAFWKVTVKNNADVPVNGVVLILHVKDGEGKDIDTLMKPIGTMNPGDVTSADYYWRSPNHIIAFPKLEIKNDPLPKHELKDVIETKSAPDQKTEQPE